MWYISHAPLLTASLWIMHKYINPEYSYYPALTDTDWQLPHTPGLPHAVGHPLPHQPEPLVAAKPDS